MRESCKNGKQGEQAERCVGCGQSQAMMLIAFK